MATVMSMVILLLIVSSHSFNFIVPLDMLRLRIQLVMSAMMNFVVTLEFAHIHTIFSTLIMIHLIGIVINDLNDLNDLNDEE